MERGEWSAGVGGGGGALIAWGVSVGSGRGGGRVLGEDGQQKSALQRRRPPRCLRLPAGGSRADAGRSGGRGRERSVTVHRGINAGL